MTGLAYADRRGNVFFDETLEPLADGGIPRPARRDELLPAPTGTVPTMLPSRRPLLRGGAVADRRTALAAVLPAGYTRLLLPAYASETSAPALPLFGYTFACTVDDALHVAAMRTDEREDWRVRRFSAGELEGAIERRRAVDPQNRVLAQLDVCAREYGCFTAQNVFLEMGEAALPVSPRCNARCIGCISEQEDDAGLPAPQSRIAEEMAVADLARVAIHHLERVDNGIVSFGQGCEGEPLLRSTTVARAIERIRAARPNGTINCNTNGSVPQALARLIDVGLDSVRISLNSFRPRVYERYYRPRGYALDDVLDAARLGRDRGIRVSLNLLTHPGVTDDAEEIAAMERFLGEVHVDMIQTRTLNIDPEIYFGIVGRPREPLGMRFALNRIRELGVRVGNFTATH